MSEPLQLNKNESEVAFKMKLRYQVFLTYVVTVNTMRITLRQVFLYRIRYNPRAPTAHSIIGWKHRN